MRLKFYRFLNSHENIPALFWFGLGVVSVGLLGVLDHRTGSRINVSLFYLAPIVLVTWKVSLTAGLFLSFFSVISWLTAEFTGVIEDAPGVFFWNTLILAGFFVVVAFLVSELRKSHEKEQQAARTDFLTGVMNRRYFHEFLQVEIDRMHRYAHPFTVVYIDLDDFKRMNDTYGHEMGDEVLRTVASRLRSLLRKTDMIARLGGDEFAVLLPFTTRQGAETVVGRLHSRLNEVVEQRNWTLTVSIGAVTCVAPPNSLEHLMDMADQVMYEVKKSTKNDARFMTWKGE